MNNKIEITIYSSWAKNVEPIVVDGIAKAREVVKRLWDAEIDLPADEEDGFATAPIVAELCGNRAEIGMVQAL